MEHVRILVRYVTVCALALMPSLCGYACVCLCLCVGSCVNSCCVTACACSTFCVYMPPAERTPSMVGVQNDI